MVTDIFVSEPKYVKTTFKILIRGVILPEIESFPVNDIYLELNIKNIKTILY